MRSCLRCSDELDEDESHVRRQISMVAFERGLYFSSLSGIDVSRSLAEFVASHTKQQTTFARLEQLDADIEPRAD